MGFALKSSEIDCFLFLSGIAACSLSLATICLVALKFCLGLKIGRRARGVSESFSYEPFLPTSVDEHFDSPGKFSVDM